MAAGACFSGGGVVDKKNTAGFKTGKEDVIAAFLTDTGAGEAMAYSNDRGRTFTWYEGNPVVKHTGRDPKVIWYSYDKNDQPLNDAAQKLGGHWVMAVYDEKDGRNIAFYTSTNLKEWIEQSHLYGYYECPEIFELPIDGDSNNTRWVVFAADAKYAVGSFDGKVFKPEHEGKHQVLYGKYYAAQTFDNAPDGRRIQMGWVRIDMPGMPFNQTFSFPHEMTLRTTDDGVRMFAEPVKEIEKLHSKTHTIRNQQLSEGQPVSVKTKDQLFDVLATFEIDSAGQVGLDIGGERVVYDVAAAKLNQAVLKPVDGKVTVRVLVDRPMMEIIGNDGRVYITQPRKPEEVSSIQAFAAGGTARLIKLEVHELDSIWR
jgi:fructan beta-fructosidase